MSGRIRTIKPELLDDEKTSSISHEAFRLFAGLILIADDYGNARGNPRYLDGAVFHSRPTEVPVEQILEELATVGETGLITRYTVHGQRYVHLRGWRVHQKVDKPGRARVPSLADADTPEAQTSLDLPFDSGENHSRESSRDPRETLAKVPETLARPSRDPRECSPVPHTPVPEVLGNDLRPPTSDLRPPTSDLRPPTDDDDRAPGRARDVPLANVHPIRRENPPLEDLPPPLEDDGPPDSDYLPEDPPTRQQLEGIIGKHLMSSSSSLSAFFSDFSEAELKARCEADPARRELEHWERLAVSIKTKQRWLVTKKTPEQDGLAFPLTIGWLLDEEHLHNVEIEFYEKFKRPKVSNGKSTSTPPVREDPELKRKLEAAARNGTTMPADFYDLVEKAKRGAV